MSRSVCSRAKWREGAADGILTTAFFLLSLSLSLTLFQLSISLRFTIGAGRRRPKTRAQYTLYEAREHELQTEKKKTNNIIVLITL